MSKRILAIFAILAVALSAGRCPADDEVPYGKGLTESNKERLVLDDLADVSDWYNGSPEETVLSRSEKHPETGRFSLKFANTVDHTKGEKSYPIGWPRTGKDLAKAKRTDWSAYDFFECWVYAESTRAALPGTPLHLGLYHSGSRRSSSFPLKQVRKDAWTKVVIPIAELAAPADVQRVQFNISESDYKHGDRVDFYIADVVLTRFVAPAVAELSLERKLLFAETAVIVAHSKLAGSQGMAEVAAQFEIGQDVKRIARTDAKAARRMEHVLHSSGPLPPGQYWARLNLRDPQGKLIDRRQTEFRVIRGPDYGEIQRAARKEPAGKEGGERQRARGEKDPSDGGGKSPPSPVWLFDMGTAQSDLRAGFTRITPASQYGKDHGYGWKACTGLKSHFHHYSREWQFSEGRGTPQPPPIYTNPITCDAVQSDKPATFLVDVPSGRYLVYMLCGLSAGSAREYHDFEVAAGGDRSRIKIPGPYIFEKRQLRASVQAGPLAVELTPRTDWAVACLIVFPEAEEKRVRAEVLDPLEQEVYFLPPDVAAKWKETKRVEDRPMPEFTAADRQRGYALFARHWSEVVYPNTAPRAEELSPELHAFASLGEHEPMTFTVLPLADLGACRVVASELRQGGATIPNAAIDVRSVRYMRVRPNYSTFFSYHVAPDVLEHWDSLELTQGCCQRYWITVKVPGDAKPGLYQGRLAFQPANGPAADIAVKLRVLPIRLQADPEPIYGMYYYDPLSHLHERNSATANDYFRRKAEWERRDMVEHGMNTHVSSVTGLGRDERGQWTIDGEETERRIALDRKFGLAGKPLVVHFPVEHWYTKLVDKRGLGSHMRLVRPDVPESFFAEVTKMVQAIEAERKRRGWPEFLYYPIDEPSTHEASVRFMVQVLRAIKQVPGVRTYVTADPSHDQFAPMWPHVDVWCCQPFAFDHDKIRQLSREKRIEFWCYPNHISGENDHTPVRGARMTWGFGFWRSGFKALIPWIYQANIGDPWNYLDGSAMDFVNRSTADGEPIPVAMWEAYREGIDDGRYLYTLGQLIQQATAKGDHAAELAREAQRDVRYVWDAIEVQEKYKHDRLWAGDDFDAYRWLLASWIERLQAGR